jgi:hypothetical protein
MEQPGATPDPDLAQVGPDEEQIAPVALEPLDAYEGAITTVYHVGVRTPTHVAGARAEVKDQINAATGVLVDVGNITDRKFDPVTQQTVTVETDTVLTVNPAHISALRG